MLCLGCRLSLEVLKHRNINIMYLFLLRIRLMYYHMGVAIVTDQVELLKGVGTPGGSNSSMFIYH